MSQVRRQTDIKEIIVHCSATPNGKFFTATDIDSWHQKRGFTRNLAEFPEHRPDLTAIGYHNVIRTDGTIEEGRALLETGAHCQGHNRSGIGICMIGTDKFNIKQWQALNRLVAKYKLIFPGILIRGHRDTSPDLNHDGKITSNEFIKICPGFSVADWLKGDKVALKGHILNVDYQ